MSTLVFCEDDISIRKMISVALRHSDHEVHVASDGEEGLEVILRVHPDVLFTDVEMPALNGIQLVERLRGLPDVAGTPVVFMTASVQRADLMRYKTMSALAPLEKPFTPTQLRAKIAETLEEIARGR